MDLIGFSPVPWVIQSVGDIFRSARANGFVVRYRTLGMPLFWNFVLLQYFLFLENGRERAAGFSTNEIERAERESSRAFVKGASECSSSEREGQTMSRARGL